MLGGTGIGRPKFPRSYSMAASTAIDSYGRTIWIADAHRDDGKRFVVRADEKLTAFLELESAICGQTESLPCMSREAVQNYEYKCASHVRRDTERS
jgi:hypothetical protein